MSSETLPPELEERFEVMHLLGRGAFGRVLAAQDRALDRKVAIKFLAPLSQERSLASRFLREAKATGRLHHPGIVQVFDHGIGQDGTCWIVYEYVEGEDLGRMLMLREPITGEQVQAWGVSLAGALAHAHRAGVLHRDLKPGNVLITPEGVARLCDFGLARLSGGNETQTRTGMLLGTPAYLSPEVFRGAEHTPQSDQFGLAATLYEALSGAPVQPPEDVREIMAGKSPALRFSAEIDQVYPALTAVLKRGLKPSPRQRFSDLEAFAAALKDPDGSAARALSAEELSSLRSQRSQPKTSWTRGGLVAVLATGLGFGLFWPRLSPPEATPPPPLPSPAPPTNADSEDLGSRLKAWDSGYRSDHGHDQAKGFPQVDSQRHRQSHRGEFLDPRHSMRVTRVFEQLMRWATADVLHAAMADSSHLFWRIDSDIDHLLAEAHDLESRLFDIDYLRNSGAGGKRLESSELVQARIDEFEHALRLFLERARASPVADHPTLLILEMRVAKYLPAVQVDAVATALLDQLEHLSLPFHGHRAVGVLASAVWRLRGHAPPSEAVRRRFLSRVQKYLLKPPSWADTATRIQLFYEAARAPFGHSLRRITPPTGPELRAWSELVATLEAASMSSEEFLALTRGAAAVRGLRERSRHRTHAPLNAILDRLEALADRASLDSKGPDSE